MYFLYWQLLNKIGLKNTRNLMISLHSCHEQSTWNVLLALKGEIVWGFQIDQISAVAQKSMSKIANDVILIEKESKQYVQ